jgi:hypothetical protein
MTPSFNGLENEKIFKPTFPKNNSKASCFRDILFHD